MGRLFRLDSPIMRFLSNAADLEAAYLLMAASGGLDHIPVLKYLCVLAIVMIGFVCSSIRRCLPGASSFGCSSAAP